MNKRIICLGAATLDTIFKVGHIPAGGGKVLPDCVVQNGSGMAIAAAVSIARLGGEVSLWTRVGDDVAGRTFIADMEREQISSAGIRRLPVGRTAFSSILVNAEGERLVVPFFDPDLDPDPGWLPLDEVKHAGAILCDVRWIEGARALLEQARRDKVPALLDADVAPPEHLRALIGLADHLLFSEPALRSLVRLETAEEAVLSIAREVNAEVICMTFGERGALLWQRSAPDDVLHVPTIKVRAIDTLNAGDVWHGAYAYCLANGWSTVRSVRAANVAAAIKCEHFGGWAGAPRFPELEERLRAIELARVQGAGALPRGQERLIP